MKRMIVCTDCVEWWAQRGLSPYKDEFTFIAYGLANQNYSCDACGKAIPLGDKCSAVSHWTTRQGYQYFRWEMDYLSDLKWACDVCGELREDKKIGVFTRDVSARHGLPKGCAKENIKYCNDKGECRSGAMHKTFFNETAKDDDQ